MIRYSVSLVTATAAAKETFAGNESFTTIRTFQTRGN
jgi:hypothetical protein